MVNSTPPPTFTAPTVAGVVAQNGPATSPKSAEWALLLKARKRSVTSQILALQAELAEVEKLLSCVAP